MRLMEQKNILEVRVRKSEERRRALMHILGNLNTLNRKLAELGELTTGATHELNNPRSRSLYYIREYRGASGHQRGRRLPW